MRFMLFVIFVITTVTNSSAETYEIDCKKDKIAIYNLYDHSIYVELYSNLRFLTGGEDEEIDRSMADLNLSEKISSKKHVYFQLSNWKKFWNFKWFKDGHFGYSQDSVGFIVWKSKKDASDDAHKRFIEWSREEISAAGGKRVQIAQIVKDMVNGKGDREPIKGLLGYIPDVPYSHGYGVFWGPGQPHEAGDLDTATVHPGKRSFRLFQYENFRGASFSTDKHEIKDFDDKYDQFDNATSSIIIYDHKWKFYKGGKFDDDHTTLDKGFYRNAKAMGIKNNSISSFKKK